MDERHDTQVGFLLPERPIGTFEAYREQGGGRALERAVAHGASWVIEEVARSGLRGRGGAGFPTGRKWSAIAAQRSGRRFLVCNAAEGEPATFKDRALLRANPYQLVEGLLIGAFALDVAEVYIGLKSSSGAEADRLAHAVAEMQQHGYCEDCTITIVRGPEEYLLGEERALLEVIEGRAPMPRLFPPYEHGLFATDIRTGWEGSPAPGRAASVPRPSPDQARSAGAGAHPTAVNNVETLCNVAHIIANGADWFRSFGTERSPGTVVVTAVGDVAHPGVAEVELGTPLRAALARAGGELAPGSAVKAVLPGVSAGVLTAVQLDVPLAHEALADAGSALGAAGFYVADESACMVEIARQWSQFLAVESCGQCPPCKQGSLEITRRVDRIEAGVAGERDLAELRAWLGRVTDANRCSLGSQEQVVIGSILTAFAGEVAEHVTLRRCPRPRTVQLPKLVDLADGVARFDERQAHKHPDWTYGEPWQPDERA